VLSRRWLTFLVMGLAFFAFGAGTMDGAARDGLLSLEALDQ
jgi:hypothetical protein